MPPPNPASRPPATFGLSLPLKIPRPRQRVFFIAAFLIFAILALTACELTEAGVAVPKISVEAAQPQDRQELSIGIQVLLLVTILSLAPSILVLTTGFTRIIVVLSLLRNAIGIPQLPPNQVLTGLALFLTLFVMFPVFDRVNTVALGPFLRNEITQQEALDRGIVPVREFMFRQTRANDLALFLSLAGKPQPRTRDDIETHVLIPAFVISELNTAFQMGLFIFVPFLVIDVVIAATLISMGIFFLPPIVISMPFKVLLFILVDGWALITRSLVTSFL
ncbi:MAG TPA: flagellar type III secretion system pore protein FliP [Candidatus Methylomirabilis sp.]|nr:flagellar type III secretion system pore protein FliP [Candidatus Methylomirabilis sp.]